MPTLQEALGVDNQKIAALLERAGARNLRRGRADCPRCIAEARRHRGTIAFTDETFFCHRCKWTGNARTLARQLGVSLPPQRPEEVEHRALIAEFESWRDACYKLLIGRLNYLTRRAEAAKKVLAILPNSETDWAILAEFHDREAALLGALDVLAFEKLSPWLEQPMKREELFRSFVEAIDAVC